MNLSVWLAAWVRSAPGRRVWGLPRHCSPPGVAHLRSKRGGKPAAETAKATEAVRTGLAEVAAKVLIALAARAVAVCLECPASRLLAATAGLGKSALAPGPPAEAL